MKVIQCWDDGVVSDIRLIEILKKYNAKATFNLCIGKNGRKRQVVGQFNNVDIVSLAFNELFGLYREFDVANHSLTHPHLTSLNREDILREVTENKAHIERLFDRKVIGFCYPFGAMDLVVREIIETTGHQYARTTKDLGNSEQNLDKLALKPNCHFLDPNFWQHYETAKEAGVFYFWGHSFEMHSEKMWQDFEAKIAYIAEDSSTQWDSIANIYK